ncbi:MAG: DUF4424 domain-containing protein [Burkholderiaceae bacterium]|nr:DUF4424 domain-containing protein [Burkholderiaceae bacterium]
MKFAISVIVMMFCCSFSNANDGIAAVGVGGIVMKMTDAVALKKEVLSVSHDKISVEYEFLNESSTDVDEMIFFPLPEYTADFHGSKEYAGQPSHFIVQVDGKEVKFKTLIVAKIDGNDVTNELKKLGLSNEQIAYFPSFTLFGKKVKPLTPRQKKQFIESGFFTETFESNELVPVWSVAIQYVWRQKFSAGKVVKVFHQYRPFIAAGPSESSLGDSFSKEYCGDTSFLKAWNKIAAEKNNYVPAAKVSYILSTGNSWKNGIEDFTLNIVKKKPGEIVSLCFPGDFRKINTTTLQVRLANFKPQQELHVYFGNIDYLDYSNGDPGLAPPLH